MSRPAEVRVALNRKGIRGWLRRNGWTNRDLAERSGLGLSTVQWALKTQDNLRGPAFETVWRIHKATGIGYEYLIEVVER